MVLTTACESQQVCVSSPTDNPSGFRFALLEIKAVLFVSTFTTEGSNMLQVMLRNFEFETLPTKPQIERVAPGIVMRPIVVGEESKGIQMPVLVHRIESD